MAPIPFNLLNGVTERTTMTDFLQQTEQMIATWQGVSAPNAPARRMAEDLTAVIAAFEAQRGKLLFEDEPASFEAALQATREGASA
jgi:hypothetical protein